MSRTARIVTAVAFAVLLAGGTAATAAADSGWGDAPVDSGWGSAPVDSGWGSAPAGDPAPRG
ncbi:hypothetical protein ACFWUQ_11145 [Streptomyces sp. NPDC058662]|uniref:hypothetical protein n=1 Tax=Streptomyces sp. NPDC058662 TaxID=3346583 RepID=UPI00365490D6